MATRKKSTEQVEKPASRSRKKLKPEPQAELSPQAELLAPPEPQASSGKRSTLPELAPDANKTHDIDAMPVAPDPVPSMEQCAPSPDSAAGEVRGPAEEIPPLVGSTVTPAPAEAGSQTWWLATNHLNMLYMLGAGMVMGPEGFGGKHYRDPASELPGWLPLFRNDVPVLALEQATSERKHLRPCMAEIDLKHVRGTVRLVTRNGEMRTGSLPAEIAADVGALLIRAPLPLTLLTRLRFRSQADRNEFESTARNYSNVDLSDVKIDVSEQTIPAPFLMTWPFTKKQENSSPVVVDQPPARGQAIGGVIAMLYHLANRSELCCSAYRIATGTGVSGDGDTVNRDPALAELPYWVTSVAMSKTAPAHARLYWGAAQALVDARLSNSPLKPVDVILDYLDRQMSSLQESGLRTRLERLTSDMRSSFGLGGGTISQLFERNKGSLSRPLLLFCLRERCIDLLEFSHPDLNDGELLLAAILFGIREGWLGLPLELRRSDVLESYVEHRMFETECSHREDELTIDAAPSRPVPLRELFPQDGRTWSIAHKESVAKFASILGWNDCIVTRFNLPEGQYRLNISPGGVEIVVRGEIKPPRTEVDMSSVLKRISQWPPLPADIEKKLRAVLNGKG